MAIENIDFNLIGKQVLVTGASSGIGRGIAQRISAAGAELILCGRNSVELEKTKTSLHAGGHSIQIGDLTDPVSQSVLVEAVTKIDGLILNAGKIELMPFQFHSEEGINQLIETNFIAPLKLTQKLLKAKKISKGGSIILLSSVTSAHFGTIGGAVYGSTKGAIQGLTKSLAIELGKNSIRVNSVSPGIIETEGIEELKKVISEDAFERDKLKYPLGRFGTPDDVAASIQFLLSDASKWITGIDLIVDGGLTCQN